MKERIPNILRAGVILMVLTVWLPTAAVLVIPHENRWVERTLDTADIKTTAANKSPYCDRPSTKGLKQCANQTEAKAHSRIDEDGWIIFGPITLGLFAGLYLTAGSLSLRPQRLVNKVE